MDQNNIFLIMSVEDSHLEPSLLDPTRFNLRNKGLLTSTGKLYKGCVKDAYTKLSIGSIPSNYESIIYHHQEKRGFGTSQKRFYHAENKSQFIGTIEIEAMQAEKQVPECVSHSKKGYGPFIAKQAREWRKFPHSPGPGKYFDCKQQTKTAAPTKKKPYFPKEKEEFKRKELLLNKQNNDTPGPGYYETVQLEDKHKLSGCRSAFVTKQKRETYIQNNLTPGLACYSSSSPQKKEVKKRQVLQDELFMKLSKQQQPLPKRFIPKRKHVDVPGPGFYDYEQPNFKPLYERVKISNTFVQGNKNRFNDPIQEVNEEPPKSPTPCTYTVPSTFDKIEKKLIDMSAFMSESRRQPFSGKGLGPNLANDGSCKQTKNFHFNIRGQWL